MTPTPANLARPWRERLLTIFGITAGVVLLAVATTGSMLRELPTFLAVTIVYSLVIGLLGTTLMPRIAASPLRKTRRALYWLLVCTCLVVIALFGTMLCEALLVLAHVTSPDRWTTAVMQNGRFAVAVSLIAGISQTLWHLVRGNLEQRNLALAEVVALRDRLLETQAAEMRQAREIQEALLPRTLPAIAGCTVAASWQPAREVGGDHYDVFPVGDATALCIADVVGKGFTAALLMSNLQAVVRACALPGVTPAGLCERVNTLLSQHLRRGRFITFFYALWEPTTGALTYCRAGHNPPLVLRADGAVEPLREGGPGLGLSRRAVYAEGRTLLAHGDALLLYTDGVTEAMTPEREEYGEERLMAVAVRARSGDAEAIRRAVLADVTAFCGGEFADDAAVVVLRVS